MQNWHQKHRSSLSFPDRVADQITKLVGSWFFILFHAVWFAGWMILKVEAFPYGLLTMIVSLEAIFLSTFIMISENHQSERDRHNAEADYETNRVAKEEIEDLQKRLSRIEIEKLEKIIALLEKRP